MKNWLKEKNWWKAPILQGEENDYGDYDWEDSSIVGQVDEPLGMMESDAIRYFECDGTLYQVINNGYRFCIATWKDGKVITIEDWELVNEE